MELNDGKVKYNDERLIQLADKFKPKKVAPFFAEFISSNPAQADIIAVTKNKLLDLLVSDMDKLEGRIARSETAEEKKLAEKVSNAGEDEK